MKYICDCINSLFFDYNSVKCGCSNTFGNLFIAPFTGDNFDINKVNSERAKIIRCFREGIVPEKCRECYMLREDTNGEIDKDFPKELDHIYIGHWYHCNCGCVYCSNRMITNLKITKNSKKSDYYDLLPTVKYLCKEGYIGKNTRVTTLGGDPAVLSEYDKIMSELLKYTDGHVIILSSGIKFSDTIYKVLKKGNAELIISVDSGTPELFKKIKQVNEFNNVIKNVKKYMKANPNNRNSVYIKYILVDGLNDNIDDLNRFVDVARKIGINKLYLNVDFNFKNYGKSIPEHWYSIFEQFLAIPDLETYIEDYCRQILEKKQIF